jgi:hypothetical protein
MDAHANRIVAARHANRIMRCSQLLARDMQLPNAPPTTNSEAGHGQITHCEEGTAFGLDATGKLAQRAKGDGRERARRERTGAQRRGTKQRTTERGKP